MAIDGLNGFQELEPNNVVADLVAFIEKELPKFPNSEEFVGILEAKKNENQHSLSFCVYMTNKCKSKYYFARENAQKGSSVIDIAVYSGSVLIFTIEAKLLPIPPGTTQHPRSEHEYVHGKGAGIQRFKDGKHGVDNTNNYLNENGLIGFVKDNDFDFWHKKINQWITDSSWGISEMLEKRYFNTTGKLTSRHKRVDNLGFLLHHFWVKVTF